MKALVIGGAEELLLQELPEPVVPRGECLVEVRLAGICRTDLELARGYLGFRGIPGHEFVGTVLAGPESLLGRRVVGEINVPLADPEGQPRPADPRHHPNRTVLGILGRPGAFAERLCLPPENLLVVPDGVSDEEAVFTEPLAAALEILEQVHLPPGASVLVLGDGKLGLLITQVLSLVGCQVTLRGHHAKKLALAGRWGARVELSAGLPDQPQPAQPLARRYPLVVEATGSRAGFGEALAAVAPRGRLVLKSTYAPAEFPALDASRVVVDEITILGSRCGRLAPALRLLAQGRLEVRGLIDHTLEFERVREAFRMAAAPGALKILVRMAGTQAVLR